MKKTKRIRIRLVKSLIGRKPKQRRTVKALGLGKVGSVVEKSVHPTIMGMVNAVSHLVEVEEVS